MASKKIELRNFGTIFRTEVNSKKFGLPFFHLQQVNITYKYVKEIFS